MSLDIFNPTVSVVSHDMAGKTILVYGSNSTGKTKQGCRLPKPYYLAFEKGINAIGGIPFASIQKWSDFVKVNKQLTNPTTLDKAKEFYSTLIFDTVEASAVMCQDYVCQKYGAERIKDGDKGFGLWDEYKKEYWRQINLLTSAGYTVYFISHEGSRTFQDENGEDYEKIYPKGDKRSIDPICDLVDVIGFLKVNGVDENGSEIKSSMYAVNTPQFLARSRFDYFPTYIEEFTAENLQMAMAEAVKKEEEINGVKTVDFVIQKEQYINKELTFEELQEKIKVIAMKLNETNRMEEYIEIIENYLGVGKKVSEATKKQHQQLELILNDLELLKIDD